MAETQHYKFPAPSLSEPADITEIGKAIEQIDDVMYDIDRFGGNIVYQIDISKVGSGNNILWVDIPEVTSYDELDGKMIAINTGVYCCTWTTPQTIYINVNGLGARAIRRPLPTNSSADYDTKQYYTDKYVKGEISRSQTLLIAFSGTSATLLNPASPPRATTSIASNSTDDVSYVTPKLIAENQNYTFTLHLSIGETGSGSFQLSEEHTYDSSELEFSDVPYVYISDDFNNTYKIKLPQRYSYLIFGGQGDLTIENSAQKNVWLYLTQDGIIFKDILTEKDGDDLDYFAGIDGRFCIYLCTVPLSYDVDYGWLPINRFENGSNSGHHSIASSAFEAKSVTQTLPDIVSTIGNAVRIKLESEIDKLESESFSGHYSDLSGKPKNATTSTDGLMSSSDKNKLDGIDTGANKYTLPTASGSTLGGVKTTSTVNSSTGYTACPIISGVPYYKDTNTTYGIATTSANGLMSAADKVKLDDTVKILLISMAEKYNAPIVVDTSITIAAGAYSGYTSPYTDADGNGIPVIIYAPNATNIAKRSCNDNFHIISVIAPNLKTISDQAFWGCHGLRFMYIPNSCTSLGGAYTFDYCENLTTLYIDKTENSLSGSPWQTYVDPKLQNIYWLRGTE